MLPPSSRSLVLICNDEDEAKRLALDFDFGVPRLFIVRSVYHGSTPNWYLRQDFALFIGDSTDWCEHPNEALARMAALYTSSWCVVVAKGRITQALFDSACEQAENAGEYVDAQIYAGVRDHWVINGLDKLNNYLSGIALATSISGAIAGDVTDDITVIELIADMYSMYDVYVHPSCGLPNITDVFMSAILQKVTSYTTEDKKPKLILASDTHDSDTLALRGKLHPAGKLILVNTTDTKITNTERNFRTSSKFISVLPAVA